MGLDNPVARRSRRTGHDLVQFADRLAEIEQPRPERASLLALSRLAVPGMGVVGVGEGRFLPVAVPHRLQVGIDDPLDVLTVEDHAAVVGFHDVGDLAGLVVSLGMDLHPVPGVVLLGSLVDIPRPERLPVVPDVMVVKELHAALHEGEDLLGLVAVLLLAGDAPDPQARNAQVHLLVERQTQPCLAGSAALSPGVEFLRLAEGVPRDVAAVGAILAPRAAGVPLLDQVLAGQLNVTVGRRTVLGLQGFVPVNNLGELQQVVDQERVADVHVAPDFGIVDVRSDPAFVTVGPGVHLAGHQVQRLDRLVQPTGILPGLVPLDQLAQGVRHFPAPALAGVCLFQQSIRPQGLAVLCGRDRLGHAPGAAREQGRNGKRR